MKVFVIIICVSAFSQASVLPGSHSTSGSCDYQGKTYQDGERVNPNPCKFCNCAQGRMMCAIADCFFTPCVDSVHKPNQCCPVCPNGHNCHGFNGQIIPGGQKVRVNEYTTCECPKMGFGNQAICTAHKDPVQIE